MSDWDLDWLGIHSTHLNAHLIRTIFSDIAHPRIIQNYAKKIESLKEPLVVAAGWKPGFSTDFCAVTLAADYHSSIVLNMSNISTVYDKDPKLYKEAKPFQNLSWAEFEKLVGKIWKPGSNLPFDPKATQLAKELGLTVYVIGKDLPNLDKILNGDDFVGTVIK
jgi:uridylate kinase